MVRRPLFAMILGSNFPKDVEAQYGSATRYKAFAFHTRAKHARNAFNIFANAFRARLLHVSFAFASRFIRVYSAFHSRLPIVSFAFDLRFIHSRLLRVRCPAS